MNRRPAEGWMTHADFIFIDILSLQLGFLFAYWIIAGVKNPYSYPSHRYLGDVMMISQLLTIIFFNNYKGVLRRSRLDEMLSIIKLSITMLVLMLMLLFIAHTTIIVSRLHVGWTILLYVIIDYFLRQINKKRLLGKSSTNENRLGKSLVIVAPGKLVDEAISKLTDDVAYRDHFISAALLTDGNIEAVKDPRGIDLLSMNRESVKKIQGDWVDEILLLQPNDYSIEHELLDDFIDMGIPVNVCFEFMNTDDWTHVEIRKIGQYRVLTKSIRFVSTNQMIIKRAMDIAGGMIGCIITGILFLFVAPAIYIKSPGPIFFAQERIGLNGRKFKMYKFRSMYTDAEQRKATLMDQNKMSNTLMFKMEDDPRIIGSEKKDKNGNPKGIGNFIRNTSIDEFPQFWNVLKGDMSLVGTRPPLKSEWELYDMHHRARMTIKPGITGLWQVSGRSEITDFEEVVRLDRDYIENWSLVEDIRILLKTMVVVLKGRGAE